LLLRLRAGSTRVTRTVASDRFGLRRIDTHVDAASGAAHRLTVTELIGVPTHAIKLNIQTKSGELTLDFTEQTVDANRRVWKSRR